jgi:hypothetical protein
MVKENKEAMRRSGVNTITDTNEFKTKEEVCLMLATVKEDNYYCEPVDNSGSNEKPVNGEE